MRKINAVLAAVLAFAAGAFLSAQVRDWHDLDKANHHINDAMGDMERAAAANHYDMAGHAHKAEQHLRAAQNELNLAIQAARGN
jgi:hypothetical protein